ncbi:MAG: TatD family hydrolase [Kiritimatiellae bacterium]|nr:TatD family hydrolase [Kiritimatiellia bacterium]MDW8458001.1 TatD family hydrolase [Verrucomicrobiota bacterium]
MPTFFDTHAHLDTFDEDGSLHDVLDRARNAGVRRIVAIGGTPAANARALSLTRENSDMLRAAVAYDRDEARAGHDIDALRLLVRDPLCVAVGETGLDYHYSPETRAEQMALFERMLTLAAEMGKPVVIHSRDAESDTLAALRAHVRQPGVPVDRPGVLHCFTGSLEFARHAADLGFFISFSGILTFKNADSLRKIARQLPADRILVETDAPYLAPVPHRGSRNEPARVAVVAAALADTRQVPLEEMAQQLWDNANRLFGWPS